MISWFRIGITPIRWRAWARPCVRSEAMQRKHETQEVLFWHDALRDSRPPGKIVSRIHQHIGYSKRTGAAANKGRMVHAFVFASLRREENRLSHPLFDQKSARQKIEDAWNAYLSIWRSFRSCLELPQVTWLLSEDGVCRCLDLGAIKNFLDQAKIVLGWRDG